MQYYKYSDNSLSDGLIGSGEGQRRNNRMEGEIFQLLQSDNPNHRGGHRGWVSVAGSLQKKKCMIAIDHLIDHAPLLKFHTAGLGGEKTTPSSSSSVWVV